MIGDLLSKLDKVKPTGRGRWIACCPAHEDRSPSLSVRELDDGRILLHCFAECEVTEVLGALGLAFEDLYPEKTSEHGRKVRRPFPAHDVLQALAFEALVVSVAAANVARGVILSEADQERLLLAAARCQRAVETI